MLLRILVIVVNCTQFTHFCRADEATDVLFKALKFVDVGDSKIAFLAAIHAEKIGHFGRALKLVQVMISPSWFIFF
jgi:hypothetical protein